MTISPNETLVAQLCDRLADERNVELDAKLMTAIAESVAKARPALEQMRRMMFSIGPFAVGIATSDRWLEDRGSVRPDG